jgi:hypothetical protein
MTKTATRRKTSKSRAPKKKTLVKGADKEAEKEMIIIDEAEGLVFETEKELFDHFSTHIEMLEEEYLALRSEDDFSDEEQLDLENYLEMTLDEPDEVWIDEKTFDDLTLFHFIRSFDASSGQTLKYVAVAYVSSEEEYPTFVFIQFPTKDNKLVQNYQRGELAYDHAYEKALQGAIDGDALGEADPLAMGLYQAMITVRSDKDITEDHFHDFAELREDTIENADEIWRKTDSSGHILVCFIKEFPDHEDLKELAYVAVTQEDEQTNVHSLLFSFPTTDKTLVDRYRQGENLQAEEIVQESSH